MKEFVSAMEDAFVAVAFSETGEHRAAIEFLAGPSGTATLRAVPQECLRRYIPSVPEGDP